MGVGFAVPTAFLITPLPLALATPSGSPSWFLYPNSGHVPPLRADKTPLHSGQGGLSTSGGCRVGI